MARLVLARVVAVPRLSNTSEEPKRGGGRAAEQDVRTRRRNTTYVFCSYYTS